MTDPLDRAAGALRTGPVPPVPPEVVAATAEAVAQRAAHAHTERRRRIMRYVRYGSATAAAAGVLAVAGVLWLPGPSPAAEFKRAMENAEKARSVRVTASTEAGGKRADVQTITRQGDRVRVERPKQTLVLDLKSLDLLTLDPAARTARRSKLGEQEAKLVGGVMGGLETIKADLADGNEKAVKDLGFVTLGGKKVSKYEVRSRRPDLTWSVWVEPRTELPVRVETTGMRIDFEKWGEEFDAGLFSLDVPQGYKRAD